VFSITSCLLQQLLPTSSPLWLFLWTGKILNYFDFKRKINLKVQILPTDFESQINGTTKIDHQGGLDHLHGLYIRCILGVSRCVMNVKIICPFTCFSNFT